ncbi:hypothetical protein L7F22_015464 [Adiantum nelumboides]|nr:hypothetical protein [Adiantum nelumboides]
MQSLSVLCARNATIARHIKRGEFQKALNVFRAMLQEALQPDTATFLSLLKSSHITVDHLQFCRVVHDHIIRLNFNADGMVCNALVHSYAKLGSLDEAHTVFQRSKSRDVMMWGAIMFARFQQKHGVHVLELFDSMLHEGILPDKFIYVCVLKTCTGTLNWGFFVSTEIVKRGFASDTSIGYVLIDMYSKNKSLDEAVKTFKDMSVHDVVSWGALIGGFSLHGKADCVLEFFGELQQEGIHPNSVILLFVLKACLDRKLLEQGMILHAHLVTNSNESNLALGSALVGLYSNCGELVEARKVFDSLFCKDSVAWAAMIGGYAQARQDLSALHLFSKLQDEGLKPSDATFSSTLKVCGVRRNLEAGKLLHHQFLEKALESNDVVVSALADMYAKCGSLMEAQDVFQMICHQDTVSCGAMIARLATQGRNLCAFDLFQQMQVEGVKPVKTTFLCVLKACSTFEDPCWGDLVHMQVVESGHEADVIVGNALIYLYVKFGSLDDARKIFNNLSDRDSVSWNTLVSGYTCHGYDISALKFVEEMHLSGIEPSEVTHSHVLKVCANMGAIHQGMITHDNMLRDGNHIDVLAGSALVSMYAKCGCLQEAQKVFDELPERNIASWGAITAGYALHGNTDMAKHCFYYMEKEGLDLTEAVFTNILVAFTHAGLLEEGCKLFSSVLRYHFNFLNAVHYSCITDLFGRVGQLSDAESFLQSMPLSPRNSSQRSLLANCRMHGNVGLGMQNFNHYVEADLLVACG